MRLGPLHVLKFLFLENALQPPRGTAWNKNRANYLFFRKNPLFPGGHGRPGSRTGSGKKAFPSVDAPLSPC